MINVKLAPVHHGDLHLTRSQQNISEGVGYVRRGSEAVGIVRALGSEVEAQGNLKVGDRVIGFPAVGSWAESVAIPAPAAIPVPPELSDEVAAQLFINYVTARMILRGLRISVPDEVLREEMDRESVVDAQRAARRWLRRPDICRRGLRPRTGGFRLSSSEYHH